ncbi:MAG: DNA polymerase III subunit epsilon [Burkholderiales bacterium]|nr:DNA polymerase III subunit epsilon [Burkholderiales bacterium]
MTVQANERLIFLDTETTGLDPRLGHRIIEIACVEAIGREVSGRHLHHYLDPEREVDAGATAVHGFSWDDLRGKPKFAAIVEELMAFLRDATVIIHNAPFDVSFLDQELARLRKPPIAGRDFSVLDSLALAKSIYPGKRNSLDALCDRLGVDNSHRNLHGALLDARLLAEAYFAMTRGQGTLDMSVPVAVTQGANATDAVGNGVVHPLTAVVLQDGIDAAHADYMARLAKQSGVERDWR